MPVLAEKTTSYRRPPCSTWVSQVVLPGVWPGVLRAVRVTPPSGTVSPSRSVRSTFTGSNRNFSESPKTW